jgi:hypothetical protein
MMPKSAKRLSGNIMLNLLESITMDLDHRSKSIVI